jgi:hypothetical protein
MKKQLLQEAVYGNMVTGFHRTELKDIINKIYDTGFRPGTGAFYGHGCYGTYEKEAQFVDGMNRYGKYILKYAVPVQNFIIFDWDIFVKTLNYKRIQDKLTTINETLTKENFLFYQFKFFPKYDLTKFAEIRKILQGSKDIFTPDIETVEYTSEIARILYENFLILPYYVDGIIFTGQSDGKVILTYNINIIIPLGYYDDTKRTVPYKQFVLKKSAIQKKLLSLDEKPKRYTKEDMEKMKELLETWGVTNYKIYPIGAIIFENPKKRNDNDISRYHTDVETLPMPILSVGEDFYLEAPNLKDYTVLPRMVYGKIMLFIPDETYEKYKKEIRPGCKTMTNNFVDFIRKNKELTDEDIRILQEGKVTIASLENCTCSKKITLNIAEDDYNVTNLKMSNIIIKNCNLSEVEIAHGNMNITMISNRMTTLTIQNYNLSYKRKYDIVNTVVDTFYCFDPLLSSFFEKNLFKKLIIDYDNRFSIRAKKIIYNGIIESYFFNNTISDCEIFNLYYRDVNTENVLDYTKPDSNLYRFEKMPSLKSSFTYDNEAGVFIEFFTPEVSLKFLKVFGYIRAGSVTLLTNGDEINEPLVLSNINTKVYNNKSLSGIFINFSDITEWRYPVIQLNNGSSNYVKIEYFGDLTSLTVYNSDIDIIHLSNDLNWNLKGLETFSGNVKKIEVPTNAPYLEALKQSPALGSIIIETYSDNA